MRATDIKAAGWGKSQVTPRRQDIQPGPYLMLGIVAMGVLTGCDSNSFVPSRPPELVSSPSAPATSSVAPSPASSPAVAAPTASAGAKTRATPGARARLVELILARPTDLDRSYLEMFLRRDTGIKKCAFRVVSPNDSEPMSRPELLATAVRTAANRSTGVLILEPVDAPAVREALREAESKGLGVVLLDSSLPAASPGKSYPFVTFHGFAEAARELVATVVDDAKVLRLPADGTTLVIENREKDFYSRDRLESITAALKAAGRAYDLVSFEGEQKGATEVVLEYLGTHPKLTIVLADHDFGVVGAYQAREQWKKTNRNMFAIAGYAACDVRLDENVKHHLQGLVDRNVEGYARKALQTAVDLMEGKPVPERTVVDVRLVHTPQTYSPPPDPEKKPGNKLERGVR